MQTLWLHNLLNFDGFRIKYKLNMFWMAQSHVYPSCDAYLMLCRSYFFNRVVMFMILKDKSVSHNLSMLASALFD